MRAILFIIFLCFTSLCVKAQRPAYTKHLQAQSAGDGRVIINQDPAIDRVVNYGYPTASKKADKNAQKSAKPDSVRHSGGSHGLENEASEEDAHSTVPGHGRARYKAQGYRIQIYTGSNSHTAKVRAQEIGAKCQKAFPMLSVYPRFISPRWTCRVGDFKTHEDAMEYANKIRAAHISTEVHIVRCEVLLAY